MINFENPLAIKIRKQIVEAIATFNLIEEGDHVMVCVSGGKDSSVLLALLQEIARRAPYTYTVEGVMLDQKQPGFDAKEYSEWIGQLGIPFKIVERDTYSIVKEKVTSGVYCSMCSRLRRGILYDHAVEHRFSKMALGHHRDDLNQTLLMNLFYTGKIASMPPKLKSDDGRNILIRPMVFVAEKDIEQLSYEWRIPVMPCNLCGSQEGMKRQMIKGLLKDLEQKIPMINQSMLSATGNIRITQMMDQKLWNFTDLKADGAPTGLQMDHFSGAEETESQQL